MLLKIFVGIFAFLILASAHGQAAAAVRRVLDYGALCNGGTNDRAAIQAAINAAAYGDVVEFPANRTCAYSGILFVNGKTQIDLYGFGKTSSILRALDQTNSALQILSSSNIVVRDLRLEVPFSTERSPLGSDNADGIYVYNSGSVTIRSVFVYKTSNAGILIRASNTVLVEYSNLYNTWADGLHITGGSSFVTARNNTAYQTGDDSFASISYKNQGINQYVGFSNNLSDASVGSGIAVEGGQFIEVHNNTAYKSRISGIRVGSDAFWHTDAVNEVSVRWNFIDQNLGQWDHGAIHVWAADANVANVHVIGNTINQTGSWAAVRFYGDYPYWTQNSQAQDNTVSDAGGITDCINVGPQTSGITVSGNTLNGGVCN